MVYINVNLSAPLALFRLPRLFCDGHFANASFRKALPRSYATWPRGQCFEVSKNSLVLVFQPLLSFLKHLPSPSVVFLFMCPFSLSLSLPLSISFSYTYTTSFSQWHHGTARELTPSTYIWTTGSVYHMWRHDTHRSHLFSSPPTLCHQQ